jgi:hypothetical protein
MIVEAPTLHQGSELIADVVIVGAGPAGIVLALELAESGIDVVLLESGTTTFDPRAQALSDAARMNEDLHAPMAMATRRQVGGASVIWGGRCVPFDPIDFQARPYLTDATWPIAYEDLTPHFEKACAWLVCGRPVFDAHSVPALPASIIPGLQDDERIKTSDMERWSLPTNFGTVYRERLRACPNLRVVTGATVTRLVHSDDGSKVVRVDCASLQGPRFSVRGADVILACGGLESTRLLLASRPDQGENGHLGRWYMGHVQGVIANVRLSTPPGQTVYDYERDVDGVYVRRRFTFTSEFQRENGLPNIAAWFANPELADPRHGSGPLSFTYLTLISPLGHLFAPEAQRTSLAGGKVPGTPYGHGTSYEGRGKPPVRAHLRNVLRDLRATIRYLLDFGVRRFISRGRRAPGYFAYSPQNLYPLQYHGEHLPHWESRVTLSDERDALGVPKLDISVHFSDQDVDGVLRAHEEWDRHLRALNLGRLEYLHEDRKAAVRERLGAGFHQAGTARMSASPDDGVVDPDLRVHGVDNLYVASSATFATSSQAHSTFMIIVFAVRLASHLRDRRRS